MIKKLCAVFIVTISVAYAHTGRLKNKTHYLFIDGENNEVRCQVQALCDIALVKGDGLVN
jgi:hypothetical protein